MAVNVVVVEHDETIVAFASDNDLTEFRRKLREYAGRGEGVFQYKLLGHISALEALQPEDRVGRRLAAEPLEDGETARLDVELMHPGSKEVCREDLARLARMLHEGGGRLTDSYVGAALCLARCQATAALLEALLQEDCILRVDRVPKPAFETALLSSARIQDLGSIPSPGPGTPGVLVVDSGVMGGHPALHPALGEAADFVGGPASGDGSDVHGHGTSVAGIAVYGDVGECIVAGRFAPAVTLFSARVLGQDNEYARDKLLETQLRDAVLHFVDHYPQCHVVNLSFGDTRLDCKPNEKQFRLAALVDELAYDLRDRDVLFVISAGNYNAGTITEETVTGYPGYLLRAPEATVIDPATAALAVTVGSLATGGPPSRFPNDVRSGVAARRGYPSPFTRLGPGVNGMVKPEVVHWGGDLLFDPRSGSGHDPGLGIPTTCHEFAPPDGRLFHAESGTSFAAPAVSNIAARLFAQFPGASANLVRALLAASARVPRDRPGHLRSADDTSGDVLRLYGYGQPDFDRAAFSEQSEVLLVAEDDVAVDSFHLYELPSIPREFREAGGPGWLSVCLAFDPPTRHTRGDSYLGVAMELNMLRNTALGQACALFRKGQSDDDLEAKLGDLPDRQRVRLRPGKRELSRGALQKGTYVSRRPGQWDCDLGSLLLAVVCRRKLAPADVDKQRYAVVVTLGHSNQDVRLHDHVRQHAKLAQRVRVRV
jgi:hypothetical protein